MEKSRAEITLDSIGDAVIGTDINGNVDYLNAAAEKITGWSRGDAGGHPVGEVFRTVNGVTRQVERDPVSQVLQHDRPVGPSLGTVLIRKDGSEAIIEDSAAPIHDEEGNLSGAVIVFHDVSTEYATTAKIAHLAHHDPLTNLPNRVLLNDRIAQAISLAKRRSTTLAVLYLDLDNFKLINDTMGHDIGDALLKSITQRLNACVRSSDTICRQGGDEFIVLLAENHDENDAAFTAEKIIAALAMPHVIEYRDIYVTTSVGISVYPADGQDAETLIRNADTAMYHAKESGRNNYQFFRPHMNAHAVERKGIEAGLRRALERQELFLHYQPKINLETGFITGVEALLRWRGQDGPAVPTEKYVSVAEDSGLIVAIGQWVLREACAQARRWIDIGLNPVSVSVNISALEFRQQNFAWKVRSILEETGLPPGYLELEIRENALMRDTRASSVQLRALKSMGVLLAVDDFGTGCSSLSYLKQFPIDVLKIDKSFVQGIERSRDGGHIASAVIGMGKSLMLRVVAEGIESEEQLSFLKARHCDEGQGYLFCRPMTAGQFAILLARSGNAIVHAAPQWSRRHESAD